MKKMKTFRMLLLLLPVAFGCNSCGNYLDVVPEGTATLDMAFNSRTQAYKYLCTCYSYLLRDGQVNSDPAMLGSDELTVQPPFWPLFWPFSYDGFYLAEGRQNATTPLFDYWGNWYQALRDCNIFLENVSRVPDLLLLERGRWIAEVTVLKAWYHFYLVRMYGAVPLMRENIPVGANVSAVKVVREPVDVCFQYIVDLLDEAIQGEMLPLEPLDPYSELGRITKPIAMSLKAKILVTAASELFNGNTQQATLKNHDGTPLFNTTYDPGKWEKAMIACKQAIDACNDAGIRLYTHPKDNTKITSDTIATQMSLRNAFNQRWNSEIIWGNTQSIIGEGHANLPQMSAANLNPVIQTWVIHNYIWVPLKIAEMFYSSNGVPLNEDNTRYFNDRYNLRSAQEADKLYVKQGSTTVDLHFDREPRFYAWIGFDGGIWFGQGRDNDREELWSLECIGKSSETSGNHTGYYAKKYIHYQNSVPSTEIYTVVPYPWPVMRLSDLYLLYAEAINEYEGPDGPHSADLFEYIRRVRARAGLQGVKESWTAYSSDPQKYTRAGTGQGVNDGMREIIRHERMIELALEGQRFWDLRRWKTAPLECNTPIEGWSALEQTPALYYTRTTYYNYKFNQRDYFWPIRNSDIIANPNLVQNIGW